jgi:hypothetical protein
VAAGAIKKLARLLSRCSGLDQAVAHPTRALAEIATGAVKSVIVPSAATGRVARASPMASLRTTMHILVARGTERNQVPL